MDIFAVDEYGDVWSAWWNGNPWRDWFMIPKATRNYAQIDVLPADGTPAAAYASHTSRANSIARHHALHTRLAAEVPQPDANDPKVTENVTTQWIAHLHAVSQDPDFHVGNDPSSLTLFRARLRERVCGEVGTKKDYDMALKGLMVIAYRYRRLLSEDDLTYILEKLVPPDLRGKHDEDVEIYMIAEDLSAFEELVGAAVIAEILTLFGALTLATIASAGFLIVEQSVYVPETENHLLMIESTRYLVNQLLFERTGDEAYNNRTNGLTDWLLGHLQTFSKHDFLEFNSRPYSRLTMHAIMNLYEFDRDRDERIRTAAKILLDYVMAKFAVSSTRGRRISPFRRLQENINHPDAQNELLLRSVGNDQLVGLFLPYVGLIDREGTPVDRFPDSWAGVSLISALSTYRPPPAVYSLAMTKYGPETHSLGDSYTFVQHIFNHGKRPRLRGSVDIPEGGVEIYAHSPSFLLTAGGMFLNSGYGHDEIEIGSKLAWAQNARAQAVTLLPARAMDVPGKPHRDVTFVDLIRFEPAPDPWTPPNKDKPIRGHAVNTGVHHGFACGTNLAVPSKWLQLTGANWEGAWLFLDLNRDLPDYGPLGFYVAIYRTASITGALAGIDNFGLLYAMEAKAGAEVMDFGTFKQRTLERNTGLPSQLKLGYHGTFNTADDHHFGFWLIPSENKYGGRIVSLNAGEVAGADPVDDLSALPLVGGRFLRSSDGHEGLIEIRSPDCDTPVILDFRNALAPEYGDNIAACPQPWFDRAKALFAFAMKLVKAGRLKEATEAVADGSRIFARLIEINPDKYRPAQAAALVDLLNTGFGAALGPQQALGYAKQAVLLYEELAGIRPPGSTAAVDYQNLGAFTPNEYWAHPRLAYALYLLARAYNAAGDLATGAVVMGPQRIKLLERLAQHDPDKYRPVLAMGLTLDLLNTGFGAALGPQPALAYAKQAVRLYEELAGIRPLGSTIAVDYQNLGTFTPNEYWAHPALAYALALLARAYNAAGDLATGAVVMGPQRIKLLERLAQHDPGKYRPVLATGLTLDLLNTGFGAALGPQPALGYAQQAVRLHEELAGIRPPGSTAVVDYQNLGAFTPNEYWAHPALAYALVLLARAYKTAGDLATGAVVMGPQRIRLLERLAQHDPDKYRPVLAMGLTLDLINSGFSAALGPQPALGYAQQAVRLYEELAGIRPLGSTTAVDYQNLAAFTPNEYWAHPALAYALYLLARAHSDAGDLPTGAVVMGPQRIRLLERLAQHDPDKYRPVLAMGLTLDLINS
ncbi:tetratricopeptide repeat protein, partial [Nonomuraea dietziae]|uniref:tetratricopeptide repeat protein n=1 Tax=Nonomuraea dietziae TaxID=65515 RepID=UPI003423DD95